MKQELKQSTRLYVCSSERLKLIGDVNGYFPDMGHHLAKEMTGMWLHPIKLIDGFWLKFTDNKTDGEVDCFAIADSFTNYPYGNEFHYWQNLSHTKVNIKRFQFAPDEIGGCVVKYTFKNNSLEKGDITAELIVRTDLRPVWFAETINVYDGAVDVIEYDNNENYFIAKDNEHEWYTIFGSDIKPDSHKSGQFFANENTNGNGVSGSLTYNIKLEPMEEKEIVFYFAGSSNSKEECIKDYKLLNNHEELLKKKKDRYENIKSKSDLTINDKEFEEIYNWVKINNDWLVQDVPGIGRGLVAGMPEYPWWFGCDSCYAIMGLLAIGEAKLARDTLDIILEASIKCNNNGRIVHEVITNGAICNPGNTQETAHFVYAVFYYYNWTKDKSFVEKCMPYMKKSIEWLEAMDEDKDLFPSGYGIMEIAGLNAEMIDSAVYTCMAYDSISKMCQILEDNETAKYYEEMHEKTKKAILDKYWIKDRNLFADMVSSTEIVKDRLEKILFQTNDENGSVRKYITDEIEKKSNNNEETGWLLNEAWVIATPMEVGIATKEQAEKSLEILDTDRFIGPYGMYLSGLDHTNTMTISTGVMAVAQGRYGHTDRSLDLLERMFRTFSMATPGAISEMSPGYGCFAQAWTIFGVGVTISSYFFGLKPDGFNNEIIFEPSIPSKWTNAKLDNVKILDGSVSVSYIYENGEKKYTIENNTSYPIVMVKDGSKKVILDGKGSTSITL